MTTRTTSLIALAMIAATAAAYALAVSGPMISIGGGITRLTYVDIASVARQSTDPSSSFDKIANLANYSKFYYFLYWIGLTALGVLCASLYESYDREINIKTVTGISFRGAGFVIVSALAFAFGLHFIELKLAVRYTELYEIAGVKAPVEEGLRNLFAPPKLGQKSPSY